MHSIQAVLSNMQSSTLQLSSCDTTSMHETKRIDSSHREHHPVLLLHPYQQHAEQLELPCHTAWPLDGLQEGDVGLQASRHVLVDAHAVLPHAMICDTGAQHGVPGPVLQQQIIPPNMDHSRHMLVPVPGQHGFFSVDVNHLWHMLVPVGSQAGMCP